MSKVKVIEVEATKLDPNAVYLVAFDSRLLSVKAMVYIAENFDSNNSAVTYSTDLEKTAEVYQIPKKADLENQD